MKRRSLKTAAFAVPFAAAFAAAVPVFAEDARPLAEKLSEAGRNTLIGLITVFVILLGLSLIISLFRFISGTGTKKEQPAKTGTDDFVIASKKSAAAAADEDGEELAAVIMAAIAAYEGEGFDPTKYRLRSVKRAGSSRRWNRARR